MTVSVNIKIGLSHARARDSINDRWYTWYTSQFCGVPPQNYILDSRIPEIHTSHIGENVNPARSTTLARVTCNTSTDCTKVSSGCKMPFGKPTRDQELVLCALKMERFLSS